MNLPSTWDSLPAFRSRDLNKMFVGFDPLFNMLATHNNNESPTNYPPYNVKKNGDKYLIEMAVSGFTKNDIKIKHEQNKLVIESDASNEEGDWEYLHQGLAKRSFKRIFNLHDEVVVDCADLNNGVLQIYLERIIPEEKRPKLIEINA